MIAPRKTEYTLSHTHIHLYQPKKVNEEKKTEKRNEDGKNYVRLGGKYLHNKRTTRIVSLSFSQPNNRCGKREHEMIADCRLGQFFFCIIHSKPMDLATTNEIYILCVVFFSLLFSLLYQWKIFTCFFFPLSNWKCVNQTFSPWQLMAYQILSHVCRHLQQFGCRYIWAWIILSRV